MERRIVVRNRIAASYEMERDKNRDYFLDSMSKKTVTRVKQANIAYRECLSRLSFDGYQVARPNTRQHAFSQNSNSQEAGLAQDFHCHALIRLFSELR